MGGSEGNDRSASCAHHFRSKLGTGTVEVDLGKFVKTLSWSQYIFLNMSLDGLNTH